MTDREAMIEVINRASSKVSFPMGPGSDLTAIYADALIEAGFGRVERKPDKCPDCGMTWLKGREDDCENEFHALENKP